MFAALTLLLTTGSVFFLCLVMFGIFTKAFEQYQERYVTRSMTDMSDMFLFIDARQVMILNICTFFMFAIVGWLVFNPIMCLLLAGVGFFAPMMMVRFYRNRRIKKFNVQMVDALQAMANAFKAGLTFPQAIEHISKESAPPLQQEFSLFVKEIKLGVPLEEALINMGKRVGSQDLELVVVSTNIARQLGGNMAEMFETISSTIRERFRLEGKIDAITSQGRMQGWVVASMPVALFFVLSYLRPDLVEPMMDHWFGYVLIAAIAVMEVLGMIIIMKIVNIDV
jgi:tight adherence protein B